MPCTYHADMPATRGDRNIGCGVDAAGGGTDGRRVLPDKPDHPASVIFAGSNPDTASNGGADELLTRQGVSDKWCAGYRDGWRR
jgi:hypothetical protein